MEGRLGVKLFDRQRSGMVPTPYAEALAPHARLLLFEMDQAIETVDALRGLRRGTLRIGAVAAIARGLLPEVVAALLARAPELQVELMEAVDDRLFAALAGRSIDLAIASAPADLSDIAVVRECEFSDQSSVICAVDHDLGRARAVTLSNILEESWIMPAKGSTPRTLFDAVIREQGLAPPRVAIETASASAIVSFVSRTRSLGWLPKSLFAHEVALGLVRALPVPEFQLSRRFMVYRRRQGLLPAAASKLIEELALRAQRA
jgi:DNA-binding transcriptional LysR family regulator